MTAGRLLDLPSFTSGEAEAPKLQAKATWDDGGAAA